MHSISKLAANEGIENIDFDSNSRRERYAGSENIASTPMTPKPNTSTASQAFYTPRTPAHRVSTTRTHVQCVSLDIADANFNHCLPPHFSLCRVLLWQMFVIVDRSRATIVGSSIVHRTRCHWAQSCSRTTGIENPSPN